MILNWKIQIIKKAIFYKTKKILDIICLIKINPQNLSSVEWNIKQGSSLKGKQLEGIMIKKKQEELEDVKIKKNWIGGNSP